MFNKINSDPNLCKENSDFLNEAFEIEKKELLEYKEPIEDKKSEDQIEVGIQLAHKLCGLYTSKLMEYYDLLHQSVAISNELEQKIKDADNLYDKCKEAAENIDSLSRPLECDSNEPHIDIPLI